MMSWIEKALFFGLGFVLLRVIILIIESSEALFDKTLLIVAISALAIGFTINYGGKKPKEVTYK